MLRRTHHLGNRACERIPARIDFSCCDIDCFGTITNISANGMFIRSQKMSFPFDSQFEICITLKEEVLKVCVKVNRITKSSGYYDGIGVELLNPTQKYLELVDSLKSAL